MRGDGDYKPNLQLLRGKSIPQRERPVRASRSTKEYTETVVVTDSETESSLNESEGAVSAVAGSELGLVDRLADFSDNSSIVTVKIEACWSPHTVSRKTENIITNLSELQTHLTQVQMAQQKDTSLADIMQQMLKMQMENDNKAREREERREEERVLREEEQQRKDEQREEEQQRREEQNRRERERWEYDMRKDREETEAKLLLTLKEAQPIVPQTVHINTTKLPKMSEGEDIQTFVELFETAMTDNNVRQEQ